MHIPAMPLQVQIGKRTCSILVPADPESLMQQSWDQHGEDENFFPFWLEAWPSSFGLYDYLLENQIPLDGALELGCGCGTLAQILAHEPGYIMHTDLVPSACAFVQKSLGMRSDRDIFAMDMTKPCLSEAPKLVLGADLFHEYRLVDTVCQFIEKFMHPHGVGYFADPMRLSRPEVPQRIAQSGIRWEKRIWNYQLNESPNELAIWQLRPPLLR